MVEEALEWMGVEETDECREPEPRTKLGIRRPGILMDSLLMVDVVVSGENSEVVMISRNCDVDIEWV